MKQLYEMLDQAKTPDDLADVKTRIQQTLFDMEQEAEWRKHVGAEGNKKWRRSIVRKGDCGRK